MSYATGESVERRLKRLEISVSDDIITEGIIASDNLINMQVNENMVDLDNPPDLLVMAGVYYAAMDILDSLYDTTEGRSSTAVEYEKRADRLVSQFLKKNPEFDPISDNVKVGGNRTPSDTAFISSSTGYVDKEGW